jgi:flagellin-like hook-associated protein FlgL
MQSRIVGLDHARSEIQDTDVAKAVGELSRTNILMQSASSMLTQANNLNRDMILKLLT